MSESKRLGRVWIVGGIVVILVVLTPLMMRIAFPPREVAGAFVEATVGREEAPVDLSAIVTGVAELSRLETAQMRVMHVSQIRQSYGIIPDMLAGDSLTLMAVGEVYAGVDLSRLAASDVRDEGDGQIVVRMPAAEVLVTRIDNEETKVLDRKTGAFRKADLGLEGRARAYAESGIREEALKKGILDLAATNAEKRVGELARSLGAKSVRFER